MSDWADLPDLIVSEIIKNLDAVTFVRFRAVCSAWYRSTEDDAPNSKLPWLLCSPISRLPWLLLSSPDQSEHRNFYSLSEKKIHGILLPDIAGHCFLGSSHGFLISVDAHADIHATNPITGTRLPIPRTATFPSIRGALRNPFSRLITAYLCDVSEYPFVCFESPDYIRRYCLRRAVVSPSADAVVVIHHSYVGGLAFARPGDASWIGLFHDLEYFYDFHDAVFHKGRLHAITYRGRLAVFDPDPPSAVPFLSPPGPDIDGLSKRYLVESPDGESLFLVSRRIDADESGALWTTGVEVFVLDNTSLECTWRPVKDLGDVAFFLGMNYSVSLSAREYPCLKGNRVYLTEADNHWIMIDHAEDFVFGAEIINLEDGSKEPLYYDKDLGRPPPLWFMPSLI